MTTSDKAIRDRRLAKDLELFQQGRVDWLYRRAARLQHDRSLPTVLPALNKISQQPLEVVTELRRAGDDDDSVWHAIITGPEGTPYEGGKFTLELRIPDRFPFERLRPFGDSPNMRFLTPIFSPGVKKDGKLLYINGAAEAFFFGEDNPAYNAFCSVLAARSVLLPDVCKLPADLQRKARLWTQWFAGAPGAPFPSLLELASYAIPSGLDDPLAGLPETMWATINDLRELRGLTSLRTRPHAARLRTRRAAAAERRQQQLLKRQRAQEKREQAKVARGTANSGATGSSNLPE